MKKSEIKVGSTYVNRGKGKTTRTVTAIGPASRIVPRVRWLSDTVPPSEPVVQFTQKGKVESLYLSSFAQWAGAEVEASR